MRKHSMPEMKEGGVNVTPLIDIVMVLIIFFMLVAKIGVTRGADDDIPLPSSIMGKPLDSLSNTWTLNIHYNRAGTDPLVDAQVSGLKRQIQVNQKYAGGTDPVLARVLQEFSAVNKGNANIIIRADKDLPYSQLEPVLVDIALAGIGKVSYEAKPGSDEPGAPASGGF